MDDYLRGSSASLVKQASAASLQASLKSLQKPIDGTIADNNKEKQMLIEADNTNLKEMMTTLIPKQDIPV